MWAYWGSWPITTILLHHLWLPLRSPRPPAMQKFPWTITWPGFQWFCSLHRDSLEYGYLPPTQASCLGSSARIPSTLSCFPLSSFSLGNTSIVLTKQMPGCPQVANTSLPLLLQELIMYKNKQTKQKTNLLIMHSLSMRRYNEFAHTKTFLEYIWHALTHLDVSISRK